MRYRLIILILIGSMWSANVNAQQTDSLKQIHINYLSKTISVSQSKAQQVVSILDEYKENAKKVISDNSLTEDTRRVKLSQLIDEKTAVWKKYLQKNSLKK